MLRGALGLDGPGGAGGAGAQLDGLPGVIATKSTGGGGAIGRIRITTRGDLGLVLNATALLSPNFEDPGTTCTRGAAALH